MRVRLGSGFRRSFSNTIFDSTFMLLGVVIGSAFGNSSLRTVLTTMLTSSLALAISTGVSVYEAESLEHHKRLAEMESALFRSLKETAIARSSRYVVAVTSLLNFLTPLALCLFTVFPFLLASFGAIGIRLAAWISVTLAMGILFLAGAYLGRLAKRNPWTKGLRMLAFGVLAFILGYWIESLI